MSGNPWPKAIDLVSGAGSATAALKAAHFQVLAAVDKPIRDHIASCPNAA